MDAVKLYLKNIDRYDLTIFTEVLVDNGYTVTYNKNNNVKTVVSISKGDEKPRKNNRDKFFEVFGIDPRPAGYVTNHNRAEGLATEWWDRPYEEPKEE